MNNSDLENLKNLNLTELRQRWSEQFPRAEPPSIRSLLLRELAWKVQQKMHGGMDAATRSLLRSAVQRSKAGVAGSHASPRSRVRRRKEANLKTGVKLVRLWRGVKHEVTVLEDGKRFEYRGEAHASLSQVAQRITGAHWSGPRFFGLHRMKAS